MHGLGPIFEPVPIGSMHRLVNVLHDGKLKPGGHIHSYFFLNLLFISNLVYYNIIILLTD